MKALLLVSLAGASGLAAFEREPELRVGTKTRESIEFHDGVEYRKIDVGNKDFYFRALQANDRQIEVHCGRPDGFKSGRLVEGSVRIAKRSHAFIEALTQTCNKMSGQQRRFLNPDPMVGVKLENKQENATKEKKIYLDPLAPGSVGFGGTF